MGWSHHRFSFFIQSDQYRVFTMNHRINSKNCTTLNYYTLIDKMHLALSYLDTHVYLLCEESLPSSLILRAEDHACPSPERAVLVKGSPRSWRPVSLTETVRTPETSGCFMRGFYRWLQKWGDRSLPFLFLIKRL